jgi:hypothetical protein
LGIAHARLVGEKSGLECVFKRRDPPPPPLKKGEQESQRVRAAHRQGLVRRVRTAHLQSLEVRRVYKSARGLNPWLIAKVL